MTDYNEKGTVRKKERVPQINAVIAKKKFLGSMYRLIRIFWKNKLVIWEVK